MVEKLKSLAIAQVKQQQISVIGWVTNIYYLFAVNAEHRLNIFASTVFYGRQKCQNSSVPQQYLSATYLVLIPNFCFGFKFKLVTNLIYCNFLPYSILFYAILIYSILLVIRLL
jgi:hypothetical protein